MRKVVSNFIYIFIGALLMTACGGDTPNTSVLEAPEMINSDPANGAKGLPSGNIIVVLTYNQNVTSPSSEHGKVTLGNASITTVSAVLTKVTIQASGLEKGTDYQLIIPKGVILGPTKLEAPRVSITFSTLAKQSIENVLCTSNPSTQSVKVYNFLKDNFGEKLISGTMANVNWNVNEAEWVYKHTGKYPALNAFDFVHLYASPANWIDYGNTTVIENWWNNNGLVVATWHWNVPQSEGSNDYGFYYTGKNNGTGETSFDITKAIQNSTPENLRVKADLDKIADYLLLLKAKNIPVIWRPMHEASGGWFWWGAKGAAPFKALWKLMFDTFKEKGVDNLIWVWTAQTGDNEWYPGNEYVDIVSCDIYNKTLVSEIKGEYLNLVQAYPNKIITLSECGNVANISSQWNGGAAWSWFMPWYDYNRTKDVSDVAFNETSHIYANIDWWTDALGQSVVLTRDQMPSLK
ncbi:glycosyl hydrolase [uncultured Bacteroides sp.]|uniref:glycosyl hydrolase n=1 Tax=uncultured Bacteroides sp. TaxID=162156 RepID=UPI002AAB083E|nr:glycosyl hydrolase [uncultured Bacteroides sp.]